MAGEMPSWLGAKCRLAMRSVLQDIVRVNCNPRQEARLDYYASGKQDMTCHMVSG